MMNLSKHFNQQGLALLSDVKKQSTGCMLSPYGIMTIMSLVNHGAMADTYRELQNITGYGVNAVQSLEKLIELTKIINNN